MHRLAELKNINISNETNQSIQPQPLPNHMKAKEHVTSNHWIMKQIEEEI